MYECLVFIPPPHVPVESHGTSILGVQTESEHGSLSQVPAAKKKRKIRPLGVPKMPRRFQKLLKVHKLIFIKQTGTLLRKSRELEQFTPAVLLYRPLIKFSANRGESSFKVPRRRVRTKELRRFRTDPDWFREFKVVRNGWTPRRQKGVLKMPLLLSPLRYRWE